MGQCPNLHEDGCPILYKAISYINRSSFFFHIAYSSGTLLSTMSMSSRIVAFLQAVTRSKFRGPRSASTARSQVWRSSFWPLPVIRNIRTRINYMSRSLILKTFLYFIISSFMFVVPSVRGAFCRLFNKRILDWRYLSDGRCRSSVMIIHREVNCEQYGRRAADVY